MQLPGPPRARPPHLLHQHPPRRDLAGGARAAASSTCRRSAREAAPGQPFGLGLAARRAGGRGAAPSPRRSASCRRFLAAENCYVFTINGFPYGSFHGRRGEGAGLRAGLVDAGAARLHEPASPTSWPSSCPTACAAASAPCPAPSAAGRRAACETIAENLVRHAAHLVGVSRADRARPSRSRSSRSRAASWRRIEETVALLRDGALRRAAPSR